MPGIGLQEIEVPAGYLLNVPRQLLKAPPEGGVTTMHLEIREFTLVFGCKGIGG